MRTSLVVLATLLVLPGLSAEVIVVDPGAGSGTIQAAIDAAADGDILLLQPGPATDLSFLVIDGKSLALVVSAGPVSVAGLTVAHLPAGGSVLLRGLDVNPLLGRPAFGAVYGVVEVDDCAGSVRLEGCHLQGGPVEATGFLGLVTPPWNGLLVRDSADVIVSDCTLTGGAGPPVAPSCTPLGHSPAGPGGAGVLGIGSRVAIFDCAVTGGPGGAESLATCGGPGAVAGPGADLTGCLVHVAGSSLRGGDDLPESLGAGAGLVADPTSSILLRDSTAQPGAGRPEAPAISASPGVVGMTSIPARGLVVDAVLHVGGTGTIEVNGLPGDLACVYVSANGGGAWLPTKDGVFGLGDPVLGPFVLGALPASCWQVAVRAPPALPSGTSGLVVHLQLAVISGGVASAEDVAFVTVLDASEGDASEPGSP